MARSSALDHFLQHLRKSSGAPQGTGVSDAELLRRFVDHRDEAAFELLLWRHKTLVWNVCLRVLRDAHAAEDAFQATFLILLRKGTSVRKQQSLGAWLCRVAFRAALRARDNRQQQIEKERKSLPSSVSDVSCPAEQAELYGVLHEEVDRLPKKYRVPVVLCYLQGKTYDEAAQLLDCPKGTLSTRLTHARELLRGRLAAKGVSATSALVAASLAESVSTASPSELVTSTMHVARSFLASKVLSAAIASPQVVSLTQGVLRKMFLQRMQVTALSMCLVIAVALGAGWLIQRAVFAKSDDAAAPQVVARDASKRHSREDQGANEGGGKNNRQTPDLVPLRGRVTYPDGKPAAGIRIQADGDGYVSYKSRPLTRVVTDKDGRYELRVHPNQIYLVIVEDRKWAAPPHTGFAVWPNQPLNNLDFQLRPATRVYGRVTLGPHKKPIARQYMHIQQYGRGLHSMKNVKLPNPEKSTAAVYPTIAWHRQTDKNGRFEIFLGPGVFHIIGPKQSESKKFEIKNEKALEFNFHAPRPEKGRITGIVVTGDPPRPVAGAEVRGIYRHQRGGRDLQVKTGKDGRFDAVRGLHTTVFYARSADKKMAGVVEITADAGKVTIPIQPVGQAKGRLVDLAGKPLSGKEIWYGVRVPMGDDNAPWRTSFGGKIHTDKDGRFVLQNLVVGQLYRISVTMDAYRWREVGQVRAKHAKPIALGDLTLLRASRPPNRAGRIGG